MTGLLVRHLLFSCLASFITTNNISNNVLALQPNKRRQFLIKAIVDGTVLLTPSSPVIAVEETTFRSNGLAYRLSKKDPKELRNKIFNIPPSVQIYPNWMKGDWVVSSNLNGYIFPSTKISKQQIIANYEIPGFQKCSIIAISDIGKGNNNDGVAFAFRILPNGLEDRSYNLQQSINAHLGYQAVNEVVYEISNPNRIGIDFIDYKTVNCERCELFCNARESEEYTVQNNNGDDTNKNNHNDIDVFVCSEFLRQVTFGTGSTPGIPRQVATNYAHFWTWKKIDANTLQGNLLTAAYLDPLDALYFNEPTLPVVVYSHILNAKRTINE